MSEETCSGNCGSGCSGNCSGCSQKENAEAIRLERCLSQISHKIVVMSGKGGVGKSTVSVNLALSLALAGKKVGLLDIDIHGPSIPKMLQAEDFKLVGEGDMMLPIEVGGLKVMSIGFVLESQDDAVIWRGPVKMGVIKQFLSEVDWGPLDYLVVDVPPGTGDEPLTICQLLKGDVGTVVVTTPQAVSETDVSKSLNFCQQMNLKVLGIVENMSGFVCPKCGEITYIFSQGAGEELAAKYKVPLLGKIPIEPVICQGGDQGTPFVSAYAATKAAEVFGEVVQKILKQNQED